VKRGVVTVDDLMTLNALMDMQADIDRELQR
jgi:hypothetical protein